MRTMPAEPLQPSQTTTHTSSMGCIVQLGPNKKNYSADSYFSRALVNLIQSGTLYHAFTLFSKAPYFVQRLFNHIATINVTDCVGLGGKLI